MLGCLSYEHVAVLIHAGREQHRTIRCGAVVPLASSGARGPLLGPSMLLTCGFSPRLTPGC